MPFKTEPVGYEDKLGSLRSFVRLVDIGVAQKVRGVSGFLSVDVNVPLKNYGTAAGAKQRSDADAVFESLTDGRYGI